MPRQIEIEGTHTFDLRTTIRDPKTGKTVKEQPYVGYVTQSHGNYFQDSQGFYDAQGNDITDPKASKQMEPAKVETEKSKVVLKN